MNRTKLLILFTAIALTAVGFSAPPARADSASQKIMSVVHAAGEKFHIFMMKLLHKPIENTDPSKTMVAPFANNANQAGTGASDSKLSQLPTNDTPLDQPHRSNADIGNWLTEAISESLSFNADDYNDHLKLLARGMDQTGLSQFNNWVTKSGILNALKTNNLEMNGAVNRTPFLLNEGAVDGRYRWLFEVPGMISFVPRGTTSLAQENNIDSRTLTIRAQVGRVAQSVLPDHVEIETWTVLNGNADNTDGSAGGTADSNPDSNPGSAPAPDSNSDSNSGN